MDVKNCKRALGRNQGQFAWLLRAGLDGRWAAWGADELQQLGLAVAHINNCLPKPVPPARLFAVAKSHGYDRYIHPNTALRPFFWPADPRTPPEQRGEKTRLFLDSKDGVKIAQQALEKVLLASCRQVTERGGACLDDPYRLELWWWAYDYLANGIYWYAAFLSDRLRFRPHPLTLEQWAKFFEGQLRDGGRGPHVSEGSEPAERFANTVLRKAELTWSLANWGYNAVQTLLSEAPSHKLKGVLDSGFVAKAVQDKTGATFTREALRTYSSRLSATVDDIVKGTRSWH
jgi:hypothetical protein